MVKFSSEEDCGSVPVISHWQETVLNVAVCQDKRFVGADGCVPLTSQEHDAILNDPKVS
jgi:hypothetical protein